MQFVEQLAGALSQGLRMGGRHDAASRLHEQRIADDGAQLVEGMADGRLCHAQALGAARDRALVEHHDQQSQQMTVEIQMIEFAHATDHE